MKFRLGDSWGRLAGALTTVVALALAGCGGDTSATAGKNQGAAAPDSAPQVSLESTAQGARTRR